MKDINKCPACGALRTAFSAQCPECGYDFQNAYSKVVEELNSKLENIALGDMSSSEREKLQMEIIKAFTIPQIKEELLDLLMFIQPKATVKNETKATIEWRLRQREVIGRAKMAFANDKKILAKVESYEEELNKLDKLTVLKWWKKRSFITKAIIIIGFLFVLLIIIPGKDNSPENYSVKFTKAVENKEYDDALEYLKDSPEMNRLISDQYLSLIDGLIEENRIVEAENLYNNVGKYANKNENEIHLVKTANAFLKYYIEKGNIDKAAKYAIGNDGIVLVLKNIIESGDTDAAIKFYKRNSFKLSKYDPHQRKRVLIYQDDVIESFLEEHNLLK